MKIQKIFLIFAFVTAISIFYISSVPQEKTPGIKIPILPTIYHLTVFFILTFSLIIALNPKSKLIFLITISLPAAYSILDELHQYFVPGRTCGLYDIFINFLAILIAAAFFILLKDSFKTFKYKIN